MNYALQQIRKFKTNSFAFRSFYNNEIKNYQSAKQLDGFNLIKNGNFELRDTLFYSSCDTLINIFGNISPVTNRWRRLLNSKISCNKSWKFPPFKNTELFLIFDGAATSSNVVW